MRADGAFWNSMEQRPCEEELGIRDSGFETFGFGTRGLGMGGAGDASNPEPIPNPVDELVVLGAPHGLRLTPVFAKDRPQVLVVACAVTCERTSQDSFVNGAQLLKRAVAPSVVN